MVFNRDRRIAEDLLAAFDEHLRRTRGLCTGTRRNYGWYVCVRSWRRSRTATRSTWQRSPSGKWWASSMI